MNCWRLTGAAALALAGSAAAADRSTAPVPYVDAHSHVLAQMSVDEEIAMFRKAGLSGFAIMHPAFDRLDAFRKAAPGYAIPWISLARLPQMEGLRLGEGTARTMARLVAEGRACGFGEIPTRIVPRTAPTDDLSLVTADRLAIYATAHHLKLPVSLHVDIATPAVEAAIGQIASDYPQARIILAHSGWSAEPAVIARLMDAHSNISADLSVRLDPHGGLAQAPQPANALPPGATNVISILDAQGQLDPAWRALLLRHPDRFLFAMDMTEEERPRQIGLLVATARKALSALGRRAEHRIAHGNYERLTAGCGTRNIRTAASYRPAR